MSSIDKDSCIIYDFDLNSSFNTSNLINMSKNAPKLPNSLDYREHNLMIRLNKAQRLQNPDYFYESNPFTEDEQKMLKDLTLTVKNLKVENFNKEIIQVEESVSNDTTKQSLATQTESNQTSNSSKNEQFIKSIALDTRDQLNYVNSLKKEMSDKNKKGQKGKVPSENKVVSVKEGVSTQNQNNDQAEVRNKMHLKIVVDSTTFSEVKIFKNKSDLETYSDLKVRLLTDMKKNLISRLKLFNEEDEKILEANFEHQKYLRGVKKKLEGIRFDDGDKLKEYWQQLSESNDLFFAKDKEFKDEEEKIRLINDYETLSNKIGDFFNSFDAFLKTIREYLNALNLNQSSGLILDKSIKMLCSHTEDVFFSLLTMAGNEDSDFFTTNINEAIKDANNSIGFYLFSEKPACTKCHILVEMIAECLTSIAKKVHEKNDKMEVGVFFVSKTKLKYDIEEPNKNIRSNSPIVKHIVCDFEKELGSFGKMNEDLLYTINNKFIGFEFMQPSEDKLKAFISTESKNKEEHKRKENGLSNNIKESKVTKELLMNLNKRKKAVNIVQENNNEIKKSSLLYDFLIDDNITKEDLNLDLSK